METFTKESCPLLDPNDMVPLLLPLEESKDVLTLVRLKSKVGDTTGVFLNVDGLDSVEMFFGRTGLVFVDLLKDLLLVPEDEA